jgi:hypothetical protein
VLMSSVEGRMVAKIILREIFHFDLLVPSPCISPEAELALKNAGLYFLTCLGYKDHNGISKLIESLQ